MIEPTPPGLEYLLSTTGLLPHALDLGDTGRGRRLVVPIPEGGRFEGPRMSGRMLSGAADVQLVRPDGVVELRAHGVLETDDGVRILYRNEGIRWMPPETAEAMAQGRPFDPATIYARAIPSFEAPSDSAYAWLNRSLFVSVPSRRGQEIRLDVWRLA
jgi:hypothetical protein